MPAAMETDKELIERFFQAVMMAMGHEGWSLRWTEHDAYCWRDRKRIDICLMDSHEECEQMLLHEIVHIPLIGDGNQHTPEFFQYLERLTRGFLFEGLDERQSQLRDFYLSFPPEK